MVELRPVQVAHKIAFLISHPADRQHMGPILQQFSPDEVDLVLHRTERFAELQPWLYRQRNAKYDSQVLMGERAGYHLLVTPHYIDYLQPLPWGGYAPQAWSYVFRMLGLLNLRQLTGLGLDSWNLDDWNELYDGFLCVGPWQKRQLEDFPGHKFDVGYPAFEPMLVNRPDRTELKLLRGFQLDRPVVAYYPSQGSTGGTLDQALRALSQIDAQVIVKPHPISWLKEPKSLMGLKRFPQLTVLVDEIDNAELMTLADYVICDYGNSAFAALYLDRPLILFDHRDKPLNFKNSDNLLRQYLYHFRPQGQVLQELLDNHEYWAKQVEIRQQLRPLFFEPVQHESAAQRAAEAIYTMFHQRQRDD